MDGTAFEIIIKFRTLAAEQPYPAIVQDTEDTNLLYNILGAKSPNSPWYGIDIRWGGITATNKNGTLYARGTTLKNANNGNQTTQSNITSLYNNSTDRIYYIKFSYDPSLSSNCFKIINLWNGNTLAQYSRHFTVINDLYVTIGYATNKSGNPYRYSNMKLYEFSIRKT